MVEIIGKSRSTSDNEIAKITTSLLLAFKINLDQIVEIVFLDKKAIKKLNKIFRHKDEPTDVLSFPQKAIPGKRNILGTVVICEEMAKEKKNKTKELLSHGLLHLIGYDHENNFKEWIKAQKQLK